MPSSGPLFWRELKCYKWLFEFKNAVYDQDLQYVQRICVYWLI